MFDLSADVRYANTLSHLQDKLSAVREQMPVDLTGDGAFFMDVELGEDGWLPQNFDGVWTPWQSYQDAQFEMVLLAEYNRLYGMSSTIESENEFVFANGYSFSATSLWIFVCAFAVVIVMIAIQCLNWCLVKRINKINKAKNVNLIRQTEHAYGSI
jgi:hypothetical protein